MTDHLLVAQDLHIEHYARHGDASWLLRDAGAGGRLQIASLAIELVVDDVYWRLPEVATR